MNIAGKKTSKDWLSFRKQLVAATDDSLWKLAVNDYFHVRLDTRYLQPINWILKNDRLRGEGFSIVALQCSLIEFLESTARGLNYRYRAGTGLGEYEYSNGRDLFLKFLCNRRPFKDSFDLALARDFYAGVRCGLMHEARTAKGWSIKADAPNGSIVSRAKKIVYRNDFQAALLDFVKWYEDAVLRSHSLQEAFVRKFDNLCT